ncbi:hypothetical protein [Aquicoccus porphyridii]|uniref:Lipoprotein n=1 Tax=Aquicoccus porphyridii TaxID=1852029 RepID=A0A5A9ZT71_9RHOB|nr:hypothetical protein [Aquicoccus porphyridii]KAA0920407.1 hypothetical protein FLO80_04675 [Aquicoccus porphyridii]RAI55083.1 hypothetical protein DOO74_06105 [Rhodobacteraceae bacterium AsT-22]
MKLTLKLALCASLLAVAGCDETLGGYPADKTIDRGIDSKHLSQLQWGIWVDPRGCDTWIADDGLEGYMVRRLDKHGKPVCSGVAPPTHTAGHFKGGSRIPDPN